MAHEESLTRRLLDHTAEPGDEARSELVRSAARARLEAELGWIRAARATLAQER
jgi:metal-responsive CopG/Arc/MetJ family transcriptional regulator